VKPDGYEYHEMLFLYVDNIISVSHSRTKEAIAEIMKFYKAKDRSIKEPDIYLGADVVKFQLPDGREAWSTSPRSYAIDVVECLFKEDGEGYSLKSKVKNPFPTGYRPELDDTDNLDPSLLPASCFMQLIGILCWAVELGHIDIFQEVSVLSQYQVNPRLVYLKKPLDWGRLVYDSKTPDINKSHFNSKANWTEFYGDVKEELPPNMPEPCGKPVTISAFVNANHAGNVVTHRSHTGILIFVQNAPIIWYLKHQNTVESATLEVNWLQQGLARI